MTITAPARCSVVVISSTPVFRSDAGQMLPAARQAGRRVIDCAVAVRREQARLLCPRIAGLPAAVMANRSVLAGPAGFVRWLAGTSADAELLLDRRLMEPRNRRHVMLGSAVRRLGMPRESGAARWRDSAAKDFVLIRGLRVKPKPWRSL